MYGLPPTRTGLHYRLFLRLLLWALLLTASMDTKGGVKLRHRKLSKSVSLFGGVGCSAVACVGGISLVIGWQQGRPFYLEGLRRTCTSGCLIIL